MTAQIDWVHGETLDACLNGDHLNCGAIDKQVLEGALRVTVCECLCHEAVNLVEVPEQGGGTRWFVPGGVEVLRRRGSEYTMWVDELDPKGDAKLQARLSVLTESQLDQIKLQTTMYANMYGAPKPASITFRDVGTRAIAEAAEEGPPLKCASKAPDEKCEWGNAFCPDCHG